MADYGIEPNGTVIVFLSDRATQEVTGPKPAKGARLAFKTVSEAAQFVREREQEGYTFEGKEHLSAA
jgi:hypothetical protein